MGIRIWEIRQEWGKIYQEYIYKTEKSFLGDEVSVEFCLGNFVLSSGYYDAYYLKAQKVRHLIREEYSRVFQEADLILSPITPDVAPKIGSFQDPLEMYKSDMFTISVNLAGLPAISIPVDRDENGMPIGLQ